jgi:sterol desaturase/sphingolipid hydroxylase (fatty acid hydroxylase superfamily)
LKDSVPEDHNVENHHPNFNNDATNKAIITVGQLGVLFLCLFPAVLPLVVINNFKLELSSWILMVKDVPVQLLFGIVLPSLFYYWNPEAITHVKSTFWEMAPDWLHRFNPDRVIEINIINTE